MQSSKRADSTILGLGSCVYLITPLNGCEGQAVTHFSLGSSLLLPREVGLGKPLHKKSAVQTVFVQIAFQPPPLKQTDALWELFSPKICQFLKTAVLTLEMDILTITMVKLCS